MKKVINVIKKYILDIQYKDLFLKNTDQTGLYFKKILVQI